MSFLLTHTVPIIKTPKWASYPSVSHLFALGLYIADLHTFLICQNDAIPRPHVHPLFYIQRDTKKHEWLSLVFYQRFRPSTDGAISKENGHDTSNTATVNSKPNNSRKHQAAAETRSSKSQEPQVKEIPIEIKSTTKSKQEEQKQKSSNKQQEQKLKSSNKQQEEQKQNSSNKMQEETKQNNTVGSKPPQPPAPPMPPPPMPGLGMYRSATVHTTFYNGKSNKTPIPNLLLGAWVCIGSCACYRPDCGHWR